MQNFRAKPRTAMRDAPDAALLEHVAAVAVARLVFGPDMRIQVPPNLSDPTEFELLVRAGADDWGGVSPLTADHVNPERPWPHLDELTSRTADLGFILVERLTAHPEYLRDADRWVDPGLHAAVAALADPVTFLAQTDVSGPVGVSPMAPQPDRVRLSRSPRGPARGRTSGGWPRPPRPIPSRSTTGTGRRCCGPPATTSTRWPRPPTTCGATRSARR